MQKKLIKQEIKLSLLCIAILVITGCKKSFLDITPNHYTTEDNFYKTEDDFIEATNAVYGDMQKFILKAHILEEGRSDNTTYDNSLDQGSIGGNTQLGFMDQFLET